MRMAVTARSRDAKWSHQGPVESALLGDDFLRISVRVDFWILLSVAADESFHASRPVRVISARHRSCLNNQAVDPQVLHLCYYDLGCFGAEWHRMLASAQTRTEYDSHAVCTF